MMQGSLHRVEPDNRFAIVEPAHHFFERRQIRRRQPVPGAVESLQAHSGLAGHEAQIGFDESEAEDFERGHASSYAIHEADARGETTTVADSDARATLARNAQHLMEAWADAHNHGRRSVRAWAAAHGINEKAAHRILGGQHATNFDTLQHVASRLRVMPWQLLHPESGEKLISPLARAVANIFDALPTTSRQRAYTMIVQLLGM